jgi:hypothetical protein
LIDFPNFRGKNPPIFGFWFHNATPMMAVS